MASKKIQLPEFVDDIVLPKRFSNIIKDTVIKRLANSKDIPKTERHKLSLRFHSSYEFQEQVDQTLKLALAVSIMNACFEDFEFKPPDYISNDLHLALFFNMILTEEQQVLKDGFGDTPYMVPLGVFDNRTINSSIFETNQNETK